MHRRVSSIECALFATRSLRSLTEFDDWRMDRIVQFDRRHGVASWIGHLRVLCWRSPRRLALYERFPDVRSVPDGSDGSAITQRSRGNARSRCRRRRRIIWGPAPLPPSLRRTRPSSTINCSARASIWAMPPRGVARGAWGITLKAQCFQDIKDAGFNSVRIPISWAAHTATHPPYTIQPMFYRARGLGSNTRFRAMAAARYLPLLYAIPLDPSGRRLDLRQRGVEMHGVERFGAGAGGARARLQRSCGVGGKKQAAPLCRRIRHLP